MRSDGSKMEDSGGESDEVGDESVSRKKFIVATTLIAIALILLVLLIVMVIMLTGKVRPQKANTTKEGLLLKRKMAADHRRNFQNNVTADRQNDGEKDCIHEPPNPYGMVRSWDGMSHATGTTISYKCGNDPDEEQIMVIVCTDQNWKVLFQKTDSCVQLLHSRQCLGDPLPSTSVVPFNWNYQTRAVGTRIVYRCNRSKDSPVMRILVCTRDYEWRIFSDTSDKCMCGKPVHYALPIVAVTEDWDGKAYRPGTTVKYSCHSGMGDTHFQTIMCLFNSTWLVIKTGSCFFLVDKPSNFSDSIDYCSQMGGEMLTINDRSEQDAVKNLLIEENSFASTCIHKSFLGIREDVGKQWQTTDGTYVSGLSDLFFLVDEGREKCVVVQRVGNYKLVNVLCSGMQFCQLCEYAENGTDPDCPSSEETCYQPHNTTQDYRASIKHCQQTGGRLARVTNLYQLTRIHDVLVKHLEMVEQCDSGFYVDLRNEKRTYRTLNNDQLHYTKFVDDNRRSLNRHCVVIHELQRYMWTDEHCSLPSCFMCKMKGLPLGAFAPTDHSYVPNLPKVRKIPLLPDGRRIGERGTDTLLASLRFQLLDDAGVACDDYWVTDGFHCYLFNTSMVTNAKARKFCQDNYGSLASLVSPFERNFIVEHLINRVNNSTDADITEPLRWHVESTGGLPSLHRDEDGPHTDWHCVSVYVLPSIGWSSIDCDALAAFICHD